MNHDASTWKGQFRFGSLLSACAMAGIAALGGCGDLPDSQTGAPESGTTQHESALALPGGLSTNVMRDLRIAIRFESGSGFDNDPEAQADFRRAAVHGMAMWQSLFPAMHVTWVGDPAQANLTFRVGNFTAERAGCGWPWSKGHEKDGWTACSFYPQDWKTTGNEILFATYGLPGLRYDAFTFVSRQWIWDSYEPATYPPVEYDCAVTPCKSLGFQNGRFKNAVGPAGYDDITNSIVHEFGHTLGLVHDVEASKLLAFYGIPHPPGQTLTTPNLVTPNVGAYAHPLTTGLGAQYYGGGTEASPWLPDLRLGAMPMHFMVTTFDGSPFPGLIDPSIDQYNYRVINDDAYNYLVTKIPAYKTQAEYPNVRALIQLRKPTGERALTSSWQTANSLAQLDKRIQPSPFFFTGVFNENQIQKIAVGQTHTLAIQRDGSLWAWGKNDKGQIGDGTTTDRLSPKMISPGPTWISVAAGDKFSFALRSNGTLWAWGDRSVGQLGDGVTSATPVLAAKQIGGSDWVAVKAGDLHVVALKKDGTLWAWGYGGFGQLGNGDSANQSVPIQESTLDNRWVGIGAGAVDSMGIKEDGTLWTWGWNDRGTLGVGDFTTRNLPTQEAISFTNWSGVDGGFGHMVAQQQDGSLWTWGGNESGQIGAPVSTPQTNEASQWIAGNTWAASAAGHYHGLAIRQDGTLWSWGSNESGQLGTGAALSSGQGVAQESTHANSWSSVVAKQKVSIAVRDDGSVWGWGDNSAGQLGTGTTGTVSRPAALPWSYSVPTCTLTASAGPYKTGATITLTASTVGSVQRVEFWNGNTSLGPAITTSPYTFKWTNVQPGRYPLTCKVFNFLGQSTTSNPNDLIVDIASLTVVSAAAPASVNFTTEGTLDWIHRGFLTDVTKPPARKKNSPQILTNGTPAQESEFRRETNNGVAVSWTDGDSSAPSASNTKTDVTMVTPVVGEGIQLWATGLPGTSRQLFVYLKNTNIDAKIAIDVNGVKYEDIWSNTTTTPAYRVYKITYRPATTDTSMLVGATINTKRTGGNIGLIGATVH